MKKLKEKTAKQLAAMRDAEIDFSDISELDDQFWKYFELLKPTKKQSFSMRMEPWLLNWFKKQGPGYQTLMHTILKAYAESRK